jgi:hypothetical protein
MTLTPEQFNKLVTKDEFNELSQKVETLDGKIDLVIGMLEKSAKKESDHEIEHISNIAAHDRFQGDIDTIKTQIKLSTTV